MNRLAFLFTTLFLVIVIQIQIRTNAQVVQPAHTLPNDQRPSGPKKPAQNERPHKQIPTTKATPKPSMGDAIKNLKDRILNDTDTPQDMLQHVRDSSFRNAFHEAIDANIVNPGLINTLASVAKPLVNDYSRDTLLIDSIREDINFTFGPNVTWWKTLELKKNEQHVIVGLSNDSIVILFEHFGEYKLQQEVLMETAPTAFEIITVWDSVAETPISCLIVATELQLIWYTMRPDTNFELTEEWRWPLYKMTTLIKGFKYRDIHMILLVGTHPNKHKSVSATLYEFNFERQQFWLLQRLDLAFPCSKVGLVRVGREFLVTFPQNDTAMIYTLEAGEKYRGRFNLIANYTSEMVQTVGAFQVGRYAYIAIGGRSPQIVRYANGVFTSQRIPMEAMETVEAYYEIPTPTYRDDLILLVQHKMLFSTHDLQRLDVFVWNGESFDLRSNIPCYVEDELMDNEVSCMLDLYRPTGIVGSAIILRGKKVSMIVPRYQTHSTLFNLHIELLSAEHPIRQKTQEMQDTIDAFTKIVQYQDEVISEGFAAIAEADQLYDVPLLTLQNCSLGTIHADLVIQDSHFNWPNGTIVVGSKIWSHRDTAVNVPAIAQEIEVETALLSQLEQQLNYTVRRHNDSFSLDLDQPLYVQGRVEVGGALVTDDLYVRQLEEDPPLLRVLRQTGDDSVKELRVKDLKVRHLNFETVNGIPASDLVFNTGEKIELANALIVDNVVVAQNVILPKGGTVNGVDLSESTVYFNCKNRRWDGLKFDSVEVLEDVMVQETINGVTLDLEELDARFRQASDDMTDVLVTEKLQLDGNLYVHSVNGVPWSDIIHRIVLKNRPNRLAEVRINGSLILENDNVTVYHLNGLAFPMDYLLSNSPIESIVTGYKRFVNFTNIDALDIERKINGVDLQDIVTLHDDQHIPGDVTFGELHVTERLEVKGAIRGKHLDEFLDNPSLLQTPLVKAACHFKQLFVDGPVVVEGKLNGMDVDAVLSDVVYDSEHTVTIEAAKRIASVEFGDKVTIGSGMVNEFKLDQFVTRSTEQELSVREINGNVFIHDLKLDGLFDGLNATALDVSSVKLFGDQYTETSLIFKNRENALYPDVEANELKIMKTLNSKARSEYKDTEQEELVLSGQISLSHLHVNHMKLTGSSLSGPSKMINLVHLPTFDSLRFSLSRPQQVTAPFYVNKLVVGSQIATAHVNGRDIRGLKESFDRVDNFKTHLLQGSIPIENLYVGGDLQVNMLNDVNFDALVKQVIWLNRPNRIPGTFRFLDPIQVEGNLTIRGQINNADLGDFLEDVVRKSAGVAEFHGTTVFMNGLVVEGNVNTESINNIHMSELALRNDTIYLQGDVEIQGDIFVEHLHIENHLNQEPIQNLLNSYGYDETKDVHTIKGDLYLYGAQIGSLRIAGMMNQIPNVDAHLASIIRKDQDYNFTKPLLFKNEVFFDRGFSATYLNQVDISTIQQDIVRINDQGPVEIEADRIVFAEPVYADRLAIKGDMIAANLVGCNPDVWMSTGVMINRDAEIYAKTLFSPGAFRTDHLRVDYLNGQPMNNLITLNTDQTIETTLFIHEMTITQPMEVGGYVNGVTLPYERKNTLMTYGNQRVRLPTVFHTIRVLQSLTLPPVLNGKPFGPPVAIGPEMVIESPISFRHLIVDRLETEDMISGVDFDRWYENSLWSKGRDHQTIEARISARNVRFSGDVEGNGKINGVDIMDVVQRMKAAKKNVEDQLQDYQSEMRSFCSNTKQLVDKSQSRMFFFKYFVQRQVINEHLPIVSFHFFDHLGYHFLGVNMGCESHFYQWDPTGKAFVPIFKYYTGLVEEWNHVVNGEEAIFLVTRSISEITQCEVSGLSVWLFTGVQLQLVWNTIDTASMQSVVADPVKSYKFMYCTPDVVVEYSVDGSTLEQWRLPKSALGYEFIPSRVGLGLALSDSKLLVLLSNVNKTVDEGPTVNSGLEMALFSSQSMHDRMKKTYSEKLLNSTIESAEVSDIIHPENLSPQEEYNHFGNDTVIVVEPEAVDIPEPPVSEDQLPTETPIARDIPHGGIMIADNQHFPERSKGDVVAFHAGPHNKKRHLVAVSTVVHTVVQGDQDAIKIYTDIQTGKLYQVLPCHRPSHLTALELRDETILAFLEARQTVQIYIYRGMQGFVRLSNFKLTGPARAMAEVSLPQPLMIRCKLHYLAISTEQNELIMLRAKTQGDCGLAVQVDCDDVE
nr:LOW QUALITY PROTEIN: uncharacterized protein LOC109418432 [Aedes albopictus]